MLISSGHPLQAPSLNETNNQGDGFGAKDVFLSILIPLILDGIMIGCTILVWKYGPLEGDPTWPADLGIFFQCFILFIVSLIHFFAWGNIVMTNTPILLACAVGGFILQVIEEQFLLIPRYERRVINPMVTGWRYGPIESKFSFLNGTNSKWVSAYDRNLRWIWKL